MERDRYLSFHEMLCSTARQLSAAKGHDYSGDEDTLANLKRTETLGITSAPKGVLVRLGDKMSRVTELLDKEAEVEDEKLLDTIQDGVNYWVLLAALLSERGRIGVPPEWFEHWDSEGRLKAGFITAEELDDVPIRIHGDFLPCDHGPEHIVETREGTCYCRKCEEEAGT